MAKQAFRVSNKRIGNCCIGKRRKSAASPQAGTENGSLTGPQAMNVTSQSDQTSGPIKPTPGFGSFKKAGHASGGWNRNQSAGSHQSQIRRASGPIGAAKQHKQPTTSSSRPFGPAPCSWHSGQLHQSLVGRVPAAPPARDLSGKPVGEPASRPRPSGQAARRPSGTYASCVKLKAP